jgi:hypothetical protein
LCAHESARAECARRAQQLLLAHTRRRDHHGTISIGCTSIAPASLGGIKHLDPNTKLKATRGQTHISGFVIEPDKEGRRRCTCTYINVLRGGGREAGLDEGLLALPLSNLVYMENPYSYKKCQ